MNDRDSAIAELTAVFEALRVGDPRGWARSQIDEGIPQLARALFLLKSWQAVESVLDGLGDEFAAFGPEEGGKWSVAGGIKGGASIRALVREALGRLLFKFCVLLEDPGAVSLKISDARAAAIVDQVAWGMFLVDDGNAAIAPISGLEESVIETDPNQRSVSLGSV